MYLFRDGLFPSTIISPRTSGASVLRHLKYDPAADPSAHQAARQGLQDGTTCRPVTNHAQVGSTSSSITLMS